MYDLPDENPEEEYLPDQYHGRQPGILDDTFKPSNYSPDEIFTAADLNLYYDVRHTNWYKRPDWYAVVGVPSLYEGHDLRMSYVIWQEQVSPFVVVELLSPSTEDEDLGRTVSQRGKPPTKWQVYERILRVPYYIVFSRYTNEIQPFRLVGGHYELMTPTDDQLYLVPELGLSFGLWQGIYKGVNRIWLRWFTESGEMILTPDEEAAAAQEQAAAAIAEAAAAQQEVLAAQQEALAAQAEAAAAQEQARLASERAERLAAKLRELNIDLDDLG
ncbi:Uma2 family endonuclease [Microcoleus sp. FACHB-831]|nr:Uma2 family endonuclease [Microcoleus sp. FACHB-831]MBD1919894.1 Uma2 family endonuclease [Microcoleus sp. FACHB-831]